MTPRQMTKVQFIVDGAQAERERTADGTRTVRQRAGHLFATCIPERTARGNLRHMRTKGRVQKVQII